MSCLNYGTPSDIVDYQSLFGYYDIPEFDYTYIFNDNYLTVVSTTSSDCYTHLPDTIFAGVYEFPKIKYDLQLQYKNRWR